MMAEKYTTKIPTEPVKLSKMRRDYWIMYSWVKMEAVGDIEPIYFCTGLRPIEQRKEAADQFDAVWKK